MFIIVGLGNPGEEYVKTRHNTGRQVLEMIAKKLAFSPWKEDLKTKSLIAEGKIGKTKAVFVLPNNFMNNSGKSVAPFVKVKKDLESLVVLYDDLDIPIGSIKISHNRSAGGHNGLGSIIKAVKSEAFARIRIGITPTTPGGKLKRPTGEKPVIDFLMKDFREPEYAELKKVSKKITEALDVMLNEGRPKAMSMYNQ